MRFQLIYKDNESLPDSAELAILLSALNIKWNLFECRYELDVRSLEGVMELCRVAKCGVFLLPCDGGKASDLPVMHLRIEDK